MDYVPTDAMPERPPSLCDNRVLVGRQPCPRPRRRSHHLDALHMMINRHSFFSWPRTARCWTGPAVVRDLQRPSLADELWMQYIAAAAASLFLRKHLIKIIEDRTCSALSPPRRRGRTAGTGWEYPRVPAPPSSLKILVPAEPV